MFQSQVPTCAASRVSIRRPSRDPRISSLPRSAAISASMAAIRSRNAVSSGDTATFNLAFESLDLQAHPAGNEAPAVHLLVDLLVDASQGAMPALDVVTQQNRILGCIGGL